MKNEEKNKKIVKQSASSKQPVSSQHKEGEMKSEKKASPKKMTDEKEDTKKQTAKSVTSSREKISDRTLQ